MSYVDFSVRYVPGRIATLQRSALHLKLKAIAVDFLVSEPSEIMELTHLLEKEAVGIGADIGASSSGSSSSFAHSHSQSAVKRNAEFRQRLTGFLEECDRADKSGSGQNQSVRVVKRLTIRWDETTYTDQIARICNLAGQVLVSGRNVRLGEMQAAAKKVTDAGNSSESGNPLLKRQKLESSASGSKPHTSSSKSDSPFLDLFLALSPNAESCWQLLLRKMDQTPTFRFPLLSLPMGERLPFQPLRPHITGLMKKDVTFEVKLADYYGNSTATFLAAASSDNSKNSQAGVTLMSNVQRLARLTNRGKHTVVSSGATDALGMRNGEDLANWGEVIGLRMVGATNGKLWKSSDKLGGRGVVEC